MTADEIIRNELAKVEGKGALAEFVSMHNLALSQTERVELLSEALADAVQWLDSIEKGIGNYALVNSMPNGCMGRNDMLRLLETSTEKLNRELRESIAVEDYKAIHPVPRRE